MANAACFEAGQTPNLTRAFVYNAGFLKQKRLRRILELSGYRVALGIPQKDDVVAIWGNSPTAYRGIHIAKNIAVLCYALKIVFYARCIRAGIKVSRL